MVQNVRLYSLSLLYLLALLTRSSHSRSFPLPHPFLCTWILSIRESPSLLPPTLSNTDPWRRVRVVKLETTQLIHNSVDFRTVTVNDLDQIRWVVDEKDPGGEGGRLEWIDQLPSTTQDGGEGGMEE